MKMLKVGHIANTHGIRGELKVIPLTDYMERFEELDWVYMEGYKEKFYIKGVRYKANAVILSLKGYDNINLVEKFKGKYLLIDESQRRVLPEDTYYISDILGLEAYTKDNVYLGKIVDILQAGSSEVYIIQKENSTKQILIPAVKEFIPEICLQSKKITVTPIEGMIE